MDWTRIAEVIAAILIAEVIATAGRAFYRSATGHKAPEPGL